MPRTAPAITATEEQVLWFRARRGHLAGPGAATPAQAAAAIIGAQSQQLPPSLLALSMRTKGRPTAGKLKTQLFGSSPNLVRTWGQRDTLFIYDTRDWHMTVAAREEWQFARRGGERPSAAVLDTALDVIRRAGKPVTRSDLVGVAPRSYVRALEKLARIADMDPDRLAAGRLIWCLAHRGDLCVADKVGAEQSYVLRTAVFGKNAWPKRPLAPAEAAIELARRYLAAYGPATPKDVAHFFNAKVTTARQWLAVMADELVPVECGGRKELVVLAEDAREFRKKPPADATRWPVRLLPLWEAMLMGHADKSWTLPVAPERKVVWRKAGYVAAVVLARGRIVATWTQKEKRGRLAVEVSPLSGWRKTTHAAGVKREARAIAEHLELDGADVKEGN